MKTNEIKVVCEVAKYHRFSDAADNLSYSHSVVSKYVTNVENELGVRIFVRGNKASELSLTPEGQLLIPAIQQINNDFQYMLELVKQLRDDNDNMLRIGSTMRFGNVTEQEALASFLCGNPDAKLEQSTMLTKDLIKMLKANRLDAIFVVLPDEVDIREYLKNQSTDNQPDSRIYDIDIKFICKEDTLYVAVAENYLPISKPEAPLSAFKDFTFAIPITHGHDDYDITSAAQKHARKRGFELKTIHSNVYGATIFRLAQKTPVAFLAQHIEDLYSWIKFVKISDWDQSFNVYFLTMKDNKKKLLQTLKHCCLQNSDTSETM